ncbi:MAG: AlpA family transcriptional regulator, partial [Acidimicrobiales bacterium]|nr:AlpA family transcriptional regulator [Acidimicrobiales bacterium]
MQLAHTSPLAPQTRGAVPRDRLLRLPDVVTTTGCSKSTIYALMKDGKFPKSISITRRMSAWPET